MTAWWLGLGIAVGKSLSIAMWSAVTVPFRESKGGATAYKHVAVSFARTLFDNASLKEIQHVLPPVFAQKRYETHMRQQKAPPKILVLPDGTEIFCLGEIAAKKLIVYFPGGGYCLPALPGYFSQLEALSEDIKGHGKTVAVLFAKYDLAPNAQWPRQLEQAVTILRYAIQTMGKQPSDIVLQGDSSGGNLVLALLSHLAHPHPQDTVPRLLLDGTLGGTLLLSPWVDFKTNYASCGKNADRDVISAKSLNVWAKAFLNRSVKDDYNCPARTPVDWWKDIPVSRIFIGAGGDEVLLDSIRHTARKIQVRILHPHLLVCISCSNLMINCYQTEHPDVSVSIVPREFHVEPITDFALKIPPGTQFKAMATWLNQILFGTKD